MTISTKPLVPNAKFVAEILGADLCGGVNAEDFAAIASALDVYSVLVFRRQLKDGKTIDADAQLRFASQFGPLDSSYVPQVAANERVKAANPHFGEVSNLDHRGEVWSHEDKRRWFLMANYLWHSDTSYKKVPTWVTLLSAHEVPPIDGQTEFADMRAAWKNLPEEMRRLVAPLFAEHSILHSRGLTGFTAFSDEDRIAAPPVTQPLVRRNPRTGSISLYLSAHASHIVGWPIDKGQQLLQELTERATVSDNVYRHQWQVGDVVIWDNSTTLHRAMPFDEFNHRRVMKRTSVNERAPAVPANVES
jgi:alpha-ketoglutarate-dependent 2,4-dichlorophenoxyacetate dioxygenase